MAYWELTLMWWGVAQYNSNSAWWKKNVLVSLILVSSVQLYGFCINASKLYWRVCPHLNDPETPFWNMYFNKDWNGETNRCQEACGYGFMWVRKLFPFSISRKISSRHEVQNKLQSSEPNLDWAKEYFEETSVQIHYWSLFSPKIVKFAFITPINCALGLHLRSNRTDTIQKRRTGS
mgnify:CR=1 FL=1